MPGCPSYRHLKLLIANLLLGFVMFWPVLGHTFLCADHLRGSEETIAIKNILETFDFPQEYELKTSHRDLRLAIYFAFGGKDFFTGRHLEYTDMTLDHVLPKSKGGPNNLYNYVPTSHLLNGFKGSTFDEVSTIAILSIIRTVYAAKVIHEMENLSRLSDEVKSRMSEMRDPRKVALNDKGEIIENPAQLKRIQFVRKASNELKSFLSFLRTTVLKDSEIIDKVGPSVIIDLTKYNKDFTYNQMVNFISESTVKTEIEFKDQQVKTVKTYPLIQNIEPAKKSNLIEDGPHKVFITRKLFEKFVQLTDSEFLSFLESGILVENFMN